MGHVSAYGDSIAANIKCTFISVIFCFANYSFGSNIMIIIIVEHNQGFYE